MPQASLVNRVDYLLSLALSALVRASTRSAGCPPGDQFVDRSAGGGDFLFRRFAESVGRDRQLLGDLSIAQDFDFVESSLWPNPWRPSTSKVTSAPSSKASLILPTLTANTETAQRLLNPRLGIAPDHRHRATLEGRLATVAAATLVPFVTATGCLAVPTAATATNALAFAILLNSAMDVVQLHDETNFRCVCCRPGSA